MQLQVSEVSDTVTNETIELPKSLDGTMMNGSPPAEAAAVKVNAVLEENEKSSKTARSVMVTD